MGLVFRSALIAALCCVALLFLFKIVDPRATPYLLSERARLGEVARIWVPLDRIAPAMRRSAVAAEDADFCRHWGLDLNAIRAAAESGGERGGSTISQQTVKNVFLWQGRSYLRKALEALITPAAEAIWGKSRMLEIYLNVAEFGPGIFGVEAAARAYYGVAANELSPSQAARLAVLLPAPKDRDPRNLGSGLSAHARRVADGAETIRRDGRAACFVTGG